MMRKVIFLFIYGNWLGSHVVTDGWMGLGVGYSIVWMKFDLISLSMR